MDIAALGLSVDSAPAERAVVALRQLPAAARQAAAGADQLAGAAEREALAVGQSTAALGANARGAHVAGSAMRAANQNIAQSGGLARHEMINLSRQAQDVFVSLTSGQSPFTVLVQQGTQVGDIFASTRGTLRGFASQIAAMITPMRLLAGGVLALGAAAYAGFSYWKSYALALDDLSRITGTATTELSKLQTAAAIKGVGESDFASGMKRFADAVYEAKAGTNDLAVLLRLNGKTVSDTAGTMGTVANLISRAGSDQQRLHILQQAGLPATMEFVRLMRNGAAGLARAKEEAAKFGGAVNDEMVAKAREFDEAWNRAWENFGISMRSAVVGGYDLLQQLIEKGREAVGAFDRFTGGRGLSAVGENLLKSGLGTPLSQDVSRMYGTLLGQSGAAGVRDATSLAAQNRDLQLTQQRISLLGDLASVTEMVAAKEKELAALRDQGTRITAEEAKRIAELYRAQLEYARASERIGTLGAAATDTERYAVTIQGLSVRLAEGKISHEDFNRAALEAIPIFSTLKNEMADFAADVIQGFARGEGAAKAFESALSGISGQLLRMGSKNLIDEGVGGLAKGLSGILGLGASAAGPLGAVASLGLGFLGSLFSRNSAKKQAQQQAQQEAAQAAQQAAEEARRKAEQQAETAANYRYQAASLGIDAASYAGAFAKLELDIQKERAEAAKVGGEAITAYEQLAQAKRYALEKEWQDKIAALRLSYEDRIFAALNDTSTLAGKLAEYDRKAAQERADAIKTYGQVYVELEQAQAAERGKIIKDAMREQTDYYDNLRRSITDFTNGLSFSNLSALSPAEQYLAARNQFQEQYQLALSGDRTAQGGITGVAQTLLEQARNYLGPSSQYGDLVSRITSQLGALPDIAMANDPQVQELQSISASSTQMVDVLTAVQSELEQTRAENRALQQQMARLTADGNQRTETVAEEIGKMRNALVLGLQEIKLRAA